MRRTRQPQSSRRLLAAVVGSSHSLHAKVSCVLPGLLPELLTLCSIFYLFWSSLPFGHISLSLPLFSSSSCSLSSLLLVLCFSFLSFSPHFTLWERQLCVRCGCVWVCVCACISRCYCNVLMTCVVCYVSTACFYSYMWTCVCMVCVSVICGDKQVTAPLQTCLKQEVDNCGGAEYQHQKQFPTWNNLCSASCASSICQYIHSSHNLLCFFSTMLKI